MPGLLGRQHEMFRAHQVKESVPASDHITTINGAEFMVQLQGADTGILRTVTLNGGKYGRPYLRT